MPAHSSDQQSGVVLTIVDTEEVQANKLINAIYKYLKNLAESPASPIASDTQIVEHTRLLVSKLSEIISTDKPYTEKLSLFAYWIETFERPLEGGSSPIDLLSGKIGFDGQTSTRFAAGAMDAVYSVSTNTVYPDFT